MSLRKTRYYVLSVLVTAALMNSSAYGADSDSGGGQAANHAPNQANPAMQPVGTPPADKNPNKPPQIETLINVAGILTPKGKWVVEPSFQYAQTSVSRVAVEGITVIPALLVGAINIQDLSQDSYIAAMTMRYGLTSRLELEARIPYVWRSESMSARPVGNVSAEAQIYDTYGRGLGDIEMAGHYQLNQGQGIPFFIANLRVKSRTGKGPFDVPSDPNTGLLKEMPTGSGFWSVQPSLTAIFPSDPAVLYGNLSYTWNLSRDYGGTIGRISPGNAVGFGFGMGISLNDKASFSTGYDHSIISKPTQNGQVIPLSRTLHVGSFLVGYSYRLNPDTTINLNLAAGLTRDAPNVQLTLRVPFAL